MLSITPARRDANLRDTLEALYRSFGADESGSDPISLVRRYPDRRDREAAAWICSALAYGRAGIIVSNLERLLAFLGPSPAHVLAGRRFRARELAFFRHRFHGPEEAAELLTAVGTVLSREGSVGNFFQSRFEASDADVAPLLDRVSAEILGGIRRPSAAVRFLFPRPADGSACKRWNLLLRWMVRSDSVDFGLWTKIPTRALVIPTDTHVHRVARRLGFTRRRTADWKTATEITRRLARIDPEDPVKYDFALCQLGVLEICRVEPRLSLCPQCPARAVCPVGRRRAA
jgi:uncharacterized protein (TIGR02757 family)